MSRREAARKRVIAKNAQGLVLVDENHPQYQAAMMKQVCRDCVNFDVEAAQQAMMEQRFVERMVKDEEWQERWLEPYQSYGVCWAFSDSGGLRINSPQAYGICAASDLDSSLRIGSPEGSVMMLCPYYDNRKDRGRFAQSSAAGVRGPTRRNVEAAEYVRRHDERRRRGERLK